MYQKICEVIRTRLLDNSHLVDKNIMMSPEKNLGNQAPQADTLSITPWPLRLSLTSLSLSTLLGCVHSDCSIFIGMFQSLASQVS